MVRFISRLLKKMTPNDVDAGGSSKETFKLKTDEGFIETDSIPQPPRPQSRRPSDDIKSSLKHDKKKPPRCGTSNDKESEIGSPDLDGSDAKKPPSPNLGFSSEEFEDTNYQQWCSPPQTMFNISNIVNCGTVRIGNDNQIIAPHIMYNIQGGRKMSGSESSANYEAEDEQEAKKEILDVIKRGFSCLDNLTDEDKRTIRQHFNGKWQTLATNMGYTTEDIKKWENDPKFPRNKSEAIGKLLDKWERTSAATVGMLCVLLQSCNELTTAHLLALSHS